MRANLFSASDKEEEEANPVLLLTSVNVEGVQLSHEVASSDTKAHGKILFATYLWQARGLS